MAEVDELILRPRAAQAGHAVHRNLLKSVMKRSAAHKGLPPPRSVVSLEDDLLAVPAKAGQAVAHAGDHEVEAADIGVDVEVQLRREQGWIGRERRQRQTQAGGALLHN